MSNSKHNIFTFANLLKTLSVSVCAGALISVSAAAVSADSLSSTEVDSSVSASIVPEQSQPNVDVTDASVDSSAETLQAVPEAQALQDAPKPAKPAKVKLKGETKWGSGDTHPYGKQTRALRVRWNSVSGAERYQIYAKGGKYTSWKKIKTVKGDRTSYAPTNLERDTQYQFKVRATVTGAAGAFSNVQTLRTGRIDFNEEGWQAMCRIVFHEVGNSSDAMWDAPIVHVADCVINQYEAAKYLNDAKWAPYYKRYNSVQHVIFSSGGFMSDYGLACDGATYGRVSDRVKLAVYGAVYDQATVSGIEHDRGVFHWCNTGYKPTGSKVSYTYKIPWGYFSIWNSYWG